MSIIRKVVELTDEVTVYIQAEDIDYDQMPLSGQIYFALSVPRKVSLKGIAVTASTTNDGWPPIKEGREVQADLEVGFELLGPESGEKEGV